MTSIHLGSSTEFVRIELPGSFTAEGWARVSVEVAAGAFTARIEPYLEARDVSRFFAQLRELQEKLVGLAELSPVEQQFSLALVGDGKGHIKVTGVAQSMTYDNKLKFVLNLDQTFLAAPLAALEKLAAGERHV